jgi:hypothetical protein
MNVKRTGVYLLLVVGMMIVLSGCHTVVKGADKVDKAVYDELPKWM